MTITASRWRCDGFANNIVAILVAKRRVPSRQEILAILLGQGFDASGATLSGISGERAVITAIIAQLGAIPCGNPRCKTMIGRKQDCIRDHKVSLRRAPEGQEAEYDQVWNQWYLCLVCNDLKTNKRGLFGTGHGSDHARNAKLRRAERGKRPPCATELPTRPFQNGPKKKIPSRPFPRKPAAG